MTYMSMHELLGRHPAAAPVGFGRFDSGPQLRYTASGTRASERRDMRERAGHV